MVVCTAPRSRRDELAESVHENWSAVESTRAQYVQRASEFLNVLTLQNALLASQSALALATAQVAGSVTHLYRAVGGGWQAVYPAQPAARTPA